MEHENHGSNNHKNHHKRMIEDFKKRFFVVLILTIPILLLSPTIQNWIGLPIDFTGDTYILLGLSTFVFFYGGWPFLKGSYKEIFKEQIGMMTLISLAIIVAYLYSSATVFGLEGKDFFWELVTLILIMLLGHWIEMKSVLNASSALDELAKLLPNEAHLVDGENIKEVPVSEIKKDDIVLVKTGEKIPLDGVIIEGDTHIDESILTGESKPVHKNEDDKVIAGSINGNKTIKIKITHVSKDSYVSKVIEIVEESQKAKSKTQNFTDKAAFYLTIIAITTGVATFIVWYIISKDLAFSITRMATVMIITCPHALGLAIPLVVANSTTLAAKNGLIIRNRTAFENSRNITTMVFDKTGTLTKGTFEVNEYESIIDEYDKEEILQIAGSIESQSEHPIASAFLKKMKDLDLKNSDTSNVETIKGKGIKGTIDKQDYYVVSKKYLEAENIELPSSTKIETTGTISFLVKNKQAIGYFVLKDEIRDSSFEAIKTLQKKVSNAGC
jgi:Cu2+-exporting ATPase